MNKLSISISSEISNIVKVENFVETFTDYFALNPDMTSFVGVKNYANIFKDELF